MDNFIHWYYDPECEIFFKDLLKEINEKSEGYYSSPTNWQDSCYWNDTCGSVCFSYDNDSETYVQLYAFHNDEEMKREGIEERYSVLTMVNGEHETERLYQDGDINGLLVTNDRQEAIRYALESVSALLTWA